MEILILLSLLIIIVLLLQDKIVFNKKSKEESTLVTTKQTTSIMGESKSTERHLSPNHLNVSPIENHLHIPSTFDEEINDKKVDIQIPQEELDEVFESTPDFEEEEEEWGQYQIFDHDNGLATGVTFEELDTVEAFLKQQNLEVTQKETAADIIQKIQGTELFNLLENSIEGASIKIAELLDGNLSFENNSNSSFYENSNFEGFDIEDFN